MKRINHAALAAAVCAMPCAAQMNNPPLLEGVSLEYDWPNTTAAFHEIEPLRFGSTLEYDAVVRYGSKMILVHRPGRFELTYVLATSVDDVAVYEYQTSSQETLDGILFKVGSLLKHMIWNWNPPYFTSTSTVTTPGQNWAGVSKLWGFTASGVTTVYGYDDQDPGFETLYRGTYDGSGSLDNTSSLAAPPGLRDLAVLEYDTNSSGLEIAWLYDDPSNGWTLEVTQTDGTNIDTFSVDADTHMGVSRSTTGADLLLWVQLDSGGDWELRAEPTASAYSKDLGTSAARSDLIVVDIDPAPNSGEDDVVLPAKTSATAIALKRSGNVFGDFEGNRNSFELRTTSNETLTAPAVVGAGADFDNDGTKDLFFGQDGTNDYWASQYLCRPDFEEQWRPHIPEGVDPDVGTPQGGYFDISFPVVNPNTIPSGTKYHLQAYVLDWQTEILETTPLYEGFKAIGSEGPQGNRTTLTFTIDENELPTDYAIFFLFGQVEETSSSITVRYPTRIGYWSPDPGIDETLASLPYPPDTDPYEDNGILTSNRLGARVGSTNLEFGLPPP